MTAVRPCFPDPGRRIAMGINELVLIGTGFVLARVVYLFYFAPRKS